MTQALPVSWFLTLRRIAFVGQVGVLVLLGLWLELPVLKLFACMCLIPLGEWIFHRARATENARRVAALLVWDTLTLTLLLYFSGGPTNPFSIVYLVHVVLSACLLGRFWSWCIALLSTACFALLFVAHQDLAALHQMDHSTGQMDHSTGLSLHLQGMLLSYALVASLIAYFLGRILTEKREAEEHVQRLADSQQKLAAIGSIAGDAAHRLGTPLATLDLVAHELSRQVAEQTQLEASELREDIAILQKEIGRCRSVIDELCSHTGNVQGVSYSDIPLRDCILQAIPESAEFGKQVKGEIPEARVRLQVAPVLIALRALIQNALDASDNTPVRVATSASETELSFCVEDEGEGIDRGELARIKEPFYTTKEHGMGLGVYIAELVAIQLGGSLQFSSAKGQGTRATLAIPLINPLTK